MTADTLWELFRRTVASTPDSEAIVDARRDEQLVYREFRDHVCGLLGALAERGVGHGDAFATVLHNGLEQSAAIVGASGLGAVLNPVNYRQSPDAIAHVVTDSDARVVVFDEANRETVAAARDELDAVGAYLYVGDDPPDWADGYDEAIEPHRGEAPPAPELAPDDGAYLLYTSGTTGPPKGCLLTNDRLVELVLQVLEEFRIDGDDRGLLAVPQSHAAGGIGGGTTPLFAGGAVVTVPEFHPVFALEWIERASLTYLPCVPAMLRALVNTGPRTFDTDSLDVVVSFGSTLPPDLARAVAEAFDLSYFGNHFGATEVGWITTRNVLSDLDAARSTGTAALNVETRVVALDDEGEAGGPDDACEPTETGELIVNSPYGMDRYLNRPAATAETFREGWYYTGDLGHVDDEGRFVPEGRKTNAIITGGINVSDVNVERVLTEHPAVAAVAVVGVPDEKWGEKVAACVVPVEDADLEADAFLDWCANRSDLADFQRPKEVVFVDEFPRSATRKVQKFKLAERITDASA